MTQSAMDKWLKAHQAQFKGQAVAFKEHVAQVCTVWQNSSASKAEYVSAAARYRLNEKLAGRMSITNLSTFIAACQYEAAGLATASQTAYKLSTSAKHNLAWAVCVIGSVSAFMLQHGQGTTKAPLIWVQSLMALLLLFYFSAPGSQWRFDSHRAKILRKLQSFQVHPDTHHFSSFEKCNSVYCIFEGDFDFSHFKAGYSQPSSLWYVGSTAVGVTK